MKELSYIHGYSLIFILDYLYQPNRLHYYNYIHFRLTKHVKQRQISKNYFLFSRYKQFTCLKSGTKDITFVVN